MNDKEWLDKILLAYKTYHHPSLPIETFIAWLYEQYGVVMPEKRNK